MRKGYITVYLALVTGVLLSLLLTIIEGVRMHTVRTQTECVMDMAMDSALAEYHRELLKQYDLFFIDTSYGGGNPGYGNTQEHIRSYMNMNFQPFSLFDIPVGKDLTGLSAEGVELLQASVASDDGGAVLRRQAADYMADKWGLSYLSQAAVYAGGLEQSGYLDSDVETRRLQAEEEVKNRILNKKEEEGEAWEGQDVELPSDVVNQARGEGILGLAASNPGSLSRTPIPTDTLLSSRQILMQGTGIAGGKREPSGITDKCLFVSYILEKCGFYGQEKENAAFSYQIEYLLEGKGNDLDNLRRVANRILLIREAANTAFLFSDSGLKSQAQSTASLICLVLGIPEAEPAVTAVILFAWAYAESVKDMRMLFDGERVPLMKTADSWNTPYSHLLTFRGHLGEYRSSGEGMSYKDYLSAFLYMQGEKTSAKRLMDVMESDIRMTPGNKGFRMDGCVDAMTAEATVSSRYGYRYQITRAYQY